MKWLADNWKLFATAALLLLCAGMAKTASYYHGKFVSADSLATERQETITDMQRRQQSIAALDAKYTKELADAKAKLDALQQCVSSGKCGLRLNAKCPTVNATGTASVDDAVSPRLTDSAQRDYFTLRERIEIAGKQIAGLQQYINEQCK